MNIYLFLSIVLIILYLVFASIIIRKHFNSIQHRLFSLFLLSIGLWSTAFYCLHISPDSDGASFWAGWLVLLTPLSATLLLHFALRWGDTKKSVLPFSSFYLYAAYIGCIALIPIATEGLVLSVTTELNGGYTLAAGSLFSIWLIFNALILLSSSLIFTKVYTVKTVNIDERNSTLYLLLGTLVILTASVFDAINMSSLPLFVFSLTAYIIFFALILTASIRYNFLNASVALRENSSYFISSLIISLPFLLIFFLLTSFTAESEFRSRLYFVVLFITAIAVAYSWQPLQMMIDKLFYREKYHNMKAIEVLSQKVLETTGLNEFLKIIPGFVSDTLKISRVNILIPVQPENSLTNIYSQNMDDYYKIPRNSKLVQRLEQTSEVLDGNDICGQEYEEYELVCPIKTTSSYLEGILMLGPKLSGKKYTGDDRRFIYTLSQQIATKLENIRLGLEIIQKEAGLEAARQSEKLKTELLSVVSHELRTPLSSIKGFVTTLLRPHIKWSEEEQKDFLQNINQETDRLTRLISNLLDMSRIEAGALKLEKDSYRISEVLESVNSTLATLTEHHKLLVSVPAGLPSVSVDRTRIGQVLINLVENAAKYSRKGSKITLEAKLVGNQVIVSVTDRGQGILGELLNTVFDRFYQGKNIAPGRRDGVGLGLSICRGIIETHGGRIWAESKVGQGSKFSFSLPVSKKEGEIVQDSGR